MSAKAAAVRNRAQERAGRSSAALSGLVAPVRMPVPLEHTEQCLIFEWAARVVVEFPDLEYLHASLNGVKLTIGQARKASAAGMRAGVPDLLLPCVRFRPDGLGVWPGAFCELKRQRGGALDPEQKRWRDYLRRQGYAWTCARGAQEAERFLLAYLGADDATIRRLVEGYL